jgi:hypothetical protein
MLTNNDKICMSKVNLRKSKSVKGEHSIAVIKCGVFEEMNMDLQNNCS